MTQSIGATIIQELIGVLRGMRKAADYNYDYPGCAQTQKQYQQTKPGDWPAVVVHVGQERPRDRQGCVESELDLTVQVLTFARDCRYGTKSPEEFMREHSDDVVRAIRSGKIKCAQNIDFTSIDPIEEGDLGDGDGLSISVNLIVSYRHSLTDPRVLNDAVA